MQFTQKEICKDKDFDLRDEIVRFSLKTIEENRFCVKAICKGMSISREAFYYHFPKRKDLIMACVSSFVVQDLLERTFRNVVSYVSFHLSFFRRNLDDKGVREFFSLLVFLLNGMSEDCGNLMMGYCYLLLSDSSVTASRFEKKMTGIFLRLGWDCCS